ncbi:hypothetical protein [Carboxylicivirga sp. RSCT41]|uniref:hypothetical protein n=1 Tax=Carboxylicivirga agarovorans TaxID=3417570 RepID=UPI003D326E20
MKKHVIISSLIILKLLTYPLLLIINPDVFISSINTLMVTDIIISMIVLNHKWLDKKYKQLIKWYKEEDRKHKIKKKQYLEFLEYQKRINE